MEWAPYLEQRRTWPAHGRHILAQYDDDTVVVYQAYAPAIADWAVQNQRFGGPWSFSRMSWIKPNFLWMMYRCGWATKPKQERVLAVRITRVGFDTILSRAVESSYRPELHGPDRDAWSRAGKRADVRMQWDPDHAPNGAKEERRAIQLGLRGGTLRAFAEEWVVAIEDVTERVHTEDARRRSEGLTALTTPRERIYPVRDAEVRRRIRLD